MEDHNFKSEIILENEKVMLRPLRINDIEFLGGYAEREPEIWKYAVKQIAGTEALRQYIKEATEAASTQKEYPFIVYDKVKQQYAGSTRYYEIQPTYDSLHLGYTWYGKDFQGTSLNKNCKYLLLQYAFENLKTERIEFRANKQNERSLAGMKSIGCTVEGVLRSHLPILTGGRRDSVILSILKDEWYRHLKENLWKKL